MTIGKRGKDYSTSYNPLQTLSEDILNNKSLENDVDDWASKNEYRRRCEIKVHKLNNASLYPLISSIIAHYNILLEFEQIRNRSPIQKFMTWMRRVAFKKILPQHNRILDKAIHHAISQYYEDYNDASLAQYLKSYIYSKKQ